MIFIDIEGGKDLDWIRTQGVETSTDTDKYGEGLYWERQYEYVLGLISISQVTYGCKAHEETNCEENS